MLKCWICRDLLMDKEFFCTYVSAKLWLNISGKDWVADRQQIKEREAKRMKNIDELKLSVTAGTKQAAEQIEGAIESLRGVDAAVGGMDAEVVMA